MSGRASTATVAIVLGWIVIGCSEAGSPSTASAPGPLELISEGRTAYQGNCIACHNPNPKLDGALGPAVAGASVELLEARIMRAEYPPGYTPTRTTKAMLAMPFLQSRIPALAAFLADEG
ncbi:MAG: cytochrome c [Myxococcota bacterium]|nr:cytochrome c [Myxococcota bacterium]